MREFDYRPKPLQVGRTFQEGRTAPQLIGKKGWQITNHTLLNSHWKTGDPLIIVSPTPLYGLGIIESFLNKFVYPLRAIGLPVRYALDFEAWKYNGIGFNRFIQNLMRWNPETSIILSGDVHYASAVRSNIYIQQKHRLTVHQFTSSPIHNMSFSGIWGMLLKIIVSFKSYSRRKKKFFRSYDKGNNLQFGNITEENRNHILWYEEIKYLSPPSGKILHNQNNIGLLTITKEFIQNKLLKTKRTSTYKKVNRKRSK
ncbi:hypothetical protein [Ornithinibacillus halotolerans]|uniref:PhoD-like phosphatase metallophosphatase domain-containing protein n=1 Tax=Ornithinibacillus halotolerans TaxID=1274357 RepID=A0A916WCJ0_9BACI|nr:hypothetical protein [Ornithinibacillus halotolerans]GGA85535.1 hypothetical protein GCM10008025_30680 [Ornithinibacillus halotolerans]